MRTTSRLLRSTCLLALFTFPFNGLDSVAEENLNRGVTLSAMDGLASPNQSTAIEVRLAARSLSGGVGLEGEPLELVVDGKVVSTATTGADGRASLALTAKAQGVTPVQIRVGSSLRVSSTEGQANLIVWERRNPIVLIEMAALLEGLSLPAPFSAIDPASDSDPKPMPDAASELGKLTQFYYRVIYVLALPVGADGFHASRQARSWLKTHEFPAGLVLALPSGEKALGMKIDELHAQGWKTIKTGVGRTKEFAEAFLHRRLEAVIVPETASSDIPRKAKVAKEWKEVRKRL